MAAGELEKKYDVPRIPDVERQHHEYLYGLYEAGILNGTDSFGTFQADKELTRAECAVMVARILDPAQRLTAPPATPNGYQQAVIELRSKLGHHNEQRFDTDDCTVFVYDRGGAMYAPLGNVTLIYKPGSALGDGTTIHCPIPNPMSGKHREPPEVMGLSEDGKTFTYTYYYEDHVHTCSVDLPSGKTTESDGSLTYENQMAFMTQGTGYTVDQRLDGPTATAVARHRTRSYWSREEEREMPFDDYELYLLSQGQNAAHRLVLPSTVYISSYYGAPTDRLPDSMYFSEDGRTLTYAYFFNEALMDGDTVLHEAGEYIYTADLTTGEVTARIDPASQQNLAYHGILGSLKTEEGYEVEYSYHSYGTFRVLSIRIEKKVNYFYEVTTSD